MDANRFYGLLAVNDLPTNKRVSCVTVRIYYDP